LQVYTVTLKSIKIPFQPNPASNLAKLILLQTLLVLCSPVFKADAAYENLSILNELIHLFQMFHLHYITDTNSFAFETNTQNDFFPGRFC
jgi:hypothetical protein